MYKNFSSIPHAKWPNVAELPTFMHRKIKFLCID